MTSFVNRMVWVAKSGNLVERMFLEKAKHALVVGSRFAKDQAEAINRAVRIGASSTKSKKRKSAPGSAVSASEITAEDLKFPLFWEKDDVVGLPYAYVEKNNRSYLNTLEDKTSVGEDLNLEFKGKLEPKLHQVEAAEKVEQALSKHRSAVLSLQCGGGKTVTALYLAAKFNKKTLIVVPTKCLMDQWKVRIEQFVPNARVGFLHGKKMQVKNVDFCVACMKSVSDLDKYPDEIFAPFGFVVYDEVHKCCAKTMLKCMWKTMSRYNLGLSATPKRQDGLESVIENTLGPVVFRTERKDEKVEIEMVTSPSNIADPWDKSMSAYGVWLTKVCANKIRNDFIANHGARLLAEGRNVIFLSDRIGHLETLRDLVKSKLAEMQKTVELAMYTGEMKQSERNLVVEQEIQGVFATFGVAGIGLDMPHLNTEILCTPHIADTTEQAVGRILRGGYSSLKFTPKVVDIVDNCEMGKQKAARRQGWYEKSKFNLSVDAVANLALENLGSIGDACIWTHEDTGEEEKEGPKRSRKGFTQKEYASSSDAFHSVGCLINL